MFWRLAICIGGESVGIHGLVFNVLGSGFWVLGSESRVHGSVNAQGTGFGVQG